MRYLISIVSLFVFVNSGFSQDYHFSQINRNNMLYNPAATGMFNGYERFSVTHRNQWIGAGTQFMTSLASGEVTIGKGIRDEKSYVGIGVLLLNDIGGDSRFGNKTGAINFAGIVPLNKQNLLSAGIQTAYTNRSADLSRVTFLSQWNGTAIDPTIPTGEENSMTTFGYLDASAGINYQYGQKQNKVVRENTISVESGFAFFHLNRPKLRYNAITTDKLDIKFVFNSKITYTVSSRAALDFCYLQAKQGKHNEIVGGIYYKTLVTEGSKITKTKQDSYLGFGAFYQSTGVLIPGVSLDFGGFKFGISYDMLLTKLRNGYGGSLEFSFSWTAMKYSIFNK